MVPSILSPFIGAHTTCYASDSLTRQRRPSRLHGWHWDFSTVRPLNAAASPWSFQTPSDDAFSKDNRTERGFVVFSDPATGQAAWNAFYSKAYTRLSLLGVNVINNLTDCTKVLPNRSRSSPFQVTQPGSSSSSVASSSTSSGISSSRCLPTPQQPQAHPASRQLAPHCGPHCYRII